MNPARRLALWLLQLFLIGAASGSAAPEPLVGNNAEICLLPPNEGLCRARIPRYYYDRHTQSCRQFFYGGCEGNANNFESKAACDEACWRIEKVPRICRLETNQKACGKPREQYYFNLMTMTCEKFMSGGCNHNENQFPDEATCMSVCAPKRGPSYCYTPKDEGLCSANVTRYYFNQRHKTCMTFTYSGCGGNENNFVNMEDCTRVCAKASKKGNKKKIPKIHFPRRGPKIERKPF